MRRLWPWEPGKKTVVQSPDVVYVRHVPMQGIVSRMSWHRCSWSCGGARSEAGRDTPDGLEQLGCVWPDDRREGFQGKCDRTGRAEAIRLGIRGDRRRLVHGGSLRRVGGDPQIPMG